MIKLKVKEVYYMEFGAEIKRLREEKGYSQRDFAEATGLSKGYISKVENNVIKPKKENIKKLSYGLEIPFLELLGKAGYMDEEFEKQFNKLKEGKLENKRPINLYSLLKGESVVLYKDRQLTENEKMKILTLIETIIE